MVPILIVDDSQEDLVFAQRVLASNRILNPVVPLSSGKACLDFFMGESEQFTAQFPCIVLLDMVMKPLGGLDVLRKLQKLPNANGSVLIMLSGLADIRMIAEGYRLGASTFLIKPLVASELKQMLESVNGLNIKKTANGHVLGLTGRNSLSSSPQSLDLEGFNPPYNAS